MSPAPWSSGPDSATAKIAAIDTEKRTVTLASADDQQSRPIPVGKDIELSKLKVGDDITVRASKGVAIWVPRSASPACGGSDSRWGRGSRPL